MRLRRWIRRRRLERDRQRALLIPLEHRITLEAARLEAAGVSPLAALAAAEAVELGHEHGLHFDRVEVDEEQLRWWGYYEPPSGAPVIVLPLVRATEATQTGIATLN